MTDLRLFDLEHSPDQKRKNEVKNLTELLKQIIPSLLSILILSVPASHAADWEGSVHLGITGTSGNSRSSSGHISFEAESKKMKLGSRYKAESTYTRTEGETTTDKSSGTIHYNYAILRKMSSYFDATAERDPVADLVWRAILGPGIGYDLLKKEHLSLIGEAGLSYLRQKYEGLEVDDYISYRFAERAVWKINSKAKVWQLIKYSPSLRDFQDRYILKAEAGIEDSLSSQILLKILVQDSYNSDPPEETLRNDVTYIVAIGYKF